MLETAKYMLEFDVALEAGAQSNPKEDDSNRESLSFVEIWRLQGVFPRTKKFTYWSVNSKTPIRMLN